MKTRSRWCQPSSSTCTRSQKRSGNIFICVVYFLDALTHLTCNARLTGSLALSIAYGIRADTPDNEFIRMYEEMLEASKGPMVPGTFLVDIFPLRGLDPFSMGCEKALTDDDLSQ